MTDISIKDACQLIGYELNEAPLELPPAEGDLSSEFFSLADVEPACELEHIIGKREYEEER